MATIILLGAAFLFAYPFLWMFLSAFKTNLEIFDPRRFWPERFDLAFYKQLFGGDYLPFFKVFTNSLLVALAQAVGAVFLTSLAGYVFARHRLPFQRGLFLVAVVVIVVPRQALAVPLFVWLHQLGLLDQLWGVILPGLVSGLGILFFTQVFRQVPDDLISMARLEGASEFRVYWTLLPLMRSALLSFGLIQFILSWHEHLVPLLVLQSPGQQTLPLALASLNGSSLRYDRAVLMAASSLMILPTAVLFALMYRRFKSSLSELLVH
jgi:sn-glycerol 3-phosphate transport system permease protein